MALATSLIPELEEIVRGDDPKRRADAARRIAELFLQGAGGFQPEHVELFDGILIGLVPHTELTVRADIAERLSSVANAPRNLVGHLAREDEIVIAGPLLRRSPVIDEQALIDIARDKGQEHLLAMTERPALSPGLTDVIIGRGDREVVRRTAGNAGASFSQTGYATLIRRAGRDGVLTLTVGQRDDLSAEQLKELVAGSIDVIRRRLLDVVKPERQTAIRQAMTDISGMMAPVEGRRNFEPAQRAILALHAAGELDESALLGFAKAYKYEESVAALSAMSGVKIATLDRLIAGDRYDPILIVSKTIGLEWVTVRALILLRLGPNRVPSPADIEGARVNFARLMPSTAERVVTFWKSRQAAYGWLVIPGWCDAPDRSANCARGISRFRVRGCASPRNDGAGYGSLASTEGLLLQQPRTLCSLPRHAESATGETTMLTDAASPVACEPHPRRWLYRDRAGREPRTGDRTASGDGPHRARASARLRQNLVRGLEDRSHQQPPDL